MRREVARRVEVVVAKRECVVRRDVPVQLGQQLVVLGLVDVPVVRPRVVPVGLDEALPDLVHGLRADAGDPEAGRTAPTRDEVRTGVLGALQLPVEEEEHLVADDGTAHREPGLEEPKVGIRHDLGSTDLVALQGVVSGERIDRAAEVVRPALGHRVDARARKATLPNVERRDGQLHLRHGVERHGLRIRLPAGRRIIEPEGVVEIRPVERDAVVEPVPSGEAEVPVAPRVDSREVARAALDRREGDDLQRVHDRHGPRAHRLRVPDAGDLLPGDLRRHTGELEVQATILSEVQEDVVRRPRLVAEERRGHSVRSTDADVGQRVRPARPGERAVLRPTRHVHGDDRRPVDGSTRGGIGHHAAERCGRDALSRESVRDRGRQQRQQRH